MTLPETIHIKRRRLKLTQTELATLCNTTQQDIQRWETGANEPKIDKLKLIAKALNCTIDELVGGDGK